MHHISECLPTKAEMNRMVKRKKSPESKLKRAACILHAVTVEVCCPHCGGAQPNPRDGSMMWDKQDIQNKERPHSICVDCDGPIFIFDYQKASFTQ